MPLLIPRALLLFLLLNAAALPLAAGDWRVLAPGLELREFRIPDRLDDLTGTQSSLAVVRIDPSGYEIALGSALQTGRPLSVQEWSRQAGFMAVINAGMFRSDDRLRSTGYMRDTQLVVSTFLHPSYGAFLLFNPRDPALPPLRWVDRKLDSDWEELLDKYSGVIQNFRLISRDRENLWEPTERRHSAAAIGLDQSGRLLFVHCRPRLSIHEFAQALLDLPLDLIGAMYVEGGADAAMYVQANGFVGRWVGEYQTDFFQGSNKNFWPAPNVLGVRPK
jgi:hypothetical protein